MNIFRNKNLPQQTQYKFFIHKTNQFTSKQLQHYTDATLTLSKMAGGSNKLVSSPLRRDSQSDRREDGIRPFSTHNENEECCLGQRPAYLPGKLLFLGKHK